MGKLISLINTTPDGFVDSRYVIADAEFHEFVHTLLANTHTVAFGKNSFEMFQEVWPSVLKREHPDEAQVRMAEALGNIPKVAYSSQLKTTTWSNSSVRAAIDAEELRREKKENEKNMLTIGSPGLVASLSRQGLVDEYYFCIQPHIAGGGDVRLFDRLNLPERLHLQFVASRALATGVVILHYKTKA